MSYREVSPIGRSTGSVIRDWLSHWLVSAEQMILWPLWVSSRIWGLEHGYLRCHLN